MPLHDLRDSSLSVGIMMQSVHAIRPIYFIIIFTCASCIYEIKWIYYLKNKIHSVTQYCHHNQHQYADTWMLEACVCVTVLTNAQMPPSIETGSLPHRL
jgi:hypothetical protein